MSDIDMSDWGVILTNAVRIFGKTLVPFIFFALIVSSINQMSQECVGSRKYYEIPALDALRHDRMDRPYQAPRGMFGQFFSDLFAPFRKFNRETGLQTYYGDRSVNYFYRKTNDSFGDYASDVFIDSWVWYRQMFFKIAVFLNKFLNIKHLNKEEQLKKFGLSIPLALIIPYFTEVSSLIPIIPSIAGMIGTLIASMRVSIFMKPFILIIILIWIIPSFLLFWVQYFYSFYLLYASGVGKKEGYSFSLVLMFLLKKYGIYYILWSSIFMGLLPFGTEIAVEKATEPNEDDDDDPQSSSSLSSSSSSSSSSDEPYNFIDTFMDGKKWASIGFSFAFSLVGWMVLIIIAMCVFSYKGSGKKELSWILFAPSWFFGKWDVTNEHVNNHKEYPIIERYYNRFVKQFEKKKDPV